MDLEGQGERGYAMAALLVMIGVAAVIMTAVLPVWRHEAQREKEAEFVFRAQQYVRAIRLYQAKLHTFPPSVDVLVQQRFLRKKYKDPIANDDFQLLYAGGQSVTPGGQAVVGTGGIIGVTSKSKAESIRVFNGATHYNQWQVLFANTRGGGPGGGGGGGGGANGGGAGGRGIGPGTGGRGGPPPAGPGGGMGQPIIRHPGGG
ncbi:MAG TPA: type II secretion system protein [Vicinamibacterales bacterium]|nr:type II secretion system protein [Vicinamibacterales bacterium]